MENLKNEEKLKFIEKMKFNNRISYFLISFNQGIGSISELALQFYFKDVLYLEPAAVSQIYSFILIPWAIKPIFGIITDLFPINGYRRKIYIIICGIMCILSWLAMTFFVKSLPFAIFFLLLINIFISFSTVLGEAVVVELSQLEKIGSNKEESSASAKDYVSMFFFFKYFGALISSYLKGFLVEAISIKWVFFITSFLPWLIVTSGFLLVEIKLLDDDNDRENKDNNTKNNNNNKNNEENKFLIYKENPNYLIIDNNNNNIIENYNLLNEENNNNNNLNNTNNNNQDKDIYNSIFYPKPAPEPITLIKSFIDFITQKYVIIPTSFVIILMATPSYSDPFFYFLTNNLKFSATLLGQISFFSTLGTLIAIWIYKTFLKNTNFRKIILIGTLFSFCVSFNSFILVKRLNLKIGISDFWFVLLSSSLLSMIGELILMPMLSLACLLCPKNLEGTVYAMFMSALNFGGIMSGLLGSFLTSSLKITSKNYDNLGNLILIANFLTICPLPFLCLIGDEYFEPRNENENNNENIYNNNENLIKENDFINKEICNLDNINIDFVKNKNININKNHEMIIIEKEKN
jgi:folate/biopterin transporter